MRCFAEESNGLLAVVRPTDLENKAREEIHGLFPFIIRNVVTRDATLVRVSGRAKILSDAGAMLVAITDFEITRIIARFDSFLPPLECQAVSSKDSVRTCDVVGFSICPA